MPRILLAPLSCRSRRQLDLLLSRPLLAILSNTFSASASSSPPRAPPLPPLSPLLPPRPEDARLVAAAKSAIAASFHDWFLESRSPACASAPAPPRALDAIYEALASDDTAALEALPLSEKLVLAVLRHRPRGLRDADALLLLRLRFFDWSGRRPRYRHTRVVYHAVFGLLACARQRRPPRLAPPLLRHTSHRRPPALPRHARRRLRRRG